ncbi:hypothetical protein ACLOJK_027537 [Asimina triloba]
MRIGSDTGDILNHGLSARLTLLSEENCLVLMKVSRERGKNERGRREGERERGKNERGREIWDRLRRDRDEHNERTGYCASGLHPDGTCSCGGLLMTEESVTRASISRIVMLAEALFEVVLDEIHRQPVSLSLSMLSVPAPESAVDSFPLKSYKKLTVAENEDDVEQ